MTDKIILAGGVATALLAIAGLFTKFVFIPLYKLIKNINELIEHNKENYINILQLKIMAPFMPLDERVAAGYEYTEVMNLNGPVHIQYEVLQEEYKKIYGKNYIKDNSK